MTEHWQPKRGVIGGLIMGGFMLAIVMTATNPADAISFLFVVVVAILCGISLAAPSKYG